MPDSLLIYFGMNCVYDVILLETQRENFMLNISGSFLPALQSKIGFIIVYVFTYIIYVCQIFRLYFGKVNYHTLTVS